MIPKPGKNPQTSLPPIRTNSTPPGPWAKSDKEKVELFAKHLSEVFAPHDDTQDPEIEKELASPNLIVVRRFEYADDPESYASGSVATGRASHAGKVEG